MDRLDRALAIATDRRRVLAGLGFGGLGLGGATLAAPALAEQLARLGFNGARDERPLTSAFPGKGSMILQRATPPLLETPMAVFDRDVFTPNDQFFVRWHYADIPTAIDVEKFRLKIRGAVGRPLSLSLARLLRMPRIELAAVNQCSGNSRGFFSPRVPGAQWGHGAMGNARWMGVRLRDVLDLAGVRAGATAVRFAGLDRPAKPGAPDFAKTLAIDHARDREVMLAFAMNGEQLPLLNGFPIRLVVPGWYSTYWVKMLDDIEVLTGADEQYWMAKAYKIPTAPRANVAPGTKDFPSVPINRMVPRSWVTSLAPGQTIGFTPTIPIGGIAMGGEHGVARVEVSADGGRRWQRAVLGPDRGRYGFRRWDAEVPLRGRGRATLLSRCWNSAGVAQPTLANWNPSGFMRGVIEATDIVIA
ncbi:MAG TPA: molybdopterin-dependent oxidoreductase [Sphingomonas sp.]|jgi:DMSO/TMAO reductase YedYZ molybdopterin-dependent catalytic subunit